MGRTYAAKISEFDGILCDKMVESHKHFKGLSFARGGSTKFPDHCRAYKIAQLVRAFDL